MSWQILKHQAHQKEEEITEAKVEGMREEAWVEFCRYVHTAGLLQRPWAMMFCSGTLWSKARVAPDRLKEWNP